ncbi:carboxylate-amine ligase [Nocardioides luteus]|uniref:carboxylate-amine ligase n=1 Tax=Nocardioides luteus TaxID=1844 RepID=UPI000B2ABB62|nr:glutamate--cysteine ligase [Nocardioides luteus]
MRPTDTARDPHVGGLGGSTDVIDAPTVGVEEEFTLLDPRSGAVVPAAIEIIRECGYPTHVVTESMRFMVETRTPVCTTLAEVHDALSAMRRRVAEVASHHGAMVVATGVAPFGLPDPPPVTDEPRYNELARRFPVAMRTNGTCGCHVHVGVPTRQVAVDALLRLRAWLPPLIALTANSPIWEGAVTGWASRRFLLASRWPTLMPAPPVRSVEEYDQMVDQAVAAGRALDRRSVYFLARLSPRYPTIEVRAADMSLTAEEAAAYAGLVRALVGMAVDDAAAGRPVVPVRQDLLRRSCLSAARDGLGGIVIDPQSGRPLRSWELIDAMVTRVRPQLRAHGDEASVLSTIDRLRRVGGGADRQRRLFRRAGSPAAFTAALAATTTGGLGAGPAR